MEISAAVELNVGSLFPEDVGSSILNIVCGIKAAWTYMFPSRLVNRAQFLVKPCWSLYNNGTPSGNLTGTEFATSDKCRSKARYTLRKSTRYITLQCSNT